MAAIFMILTAAAHTIGNVSATVPERDSALAVHAETKAVYWALVFAMSIMLTALGVINLILAATAEDRVLRVVGWANFVWVGAFGLLSLHYWITPPLISAGVIEAFVLAALLL